MKVSTRQSTLAKACLGIMTLLPASAPALINPSLQAKDLFERFQHVLVTKVSKVDENTGHLELTVISQPKGKLSSETVTMTFPPPEEDADFESEESSFEVPEIGQIVVAFAASKVRRREKDVMIYVGDRQWHEVELDPANPSSWEWTEAGEESLVGTFNGQAERLAEAVTDLADGSYFFPARVWARFQDDLVVAKSEQPFAGVAIHDLDRDGRPDIVATSGTGVRLMRQTGELKFEDQTKAWGLDGIEAKSVSIADVDADGQPDLLFGTALYLNKGSEFMGAPLPATPPVGNLKVSTFADLNGDGFPDILLSIKAGGLRAFLNPGKPGGAFEEVTQKIGLGVEPDGDGYVTLGDWNLDGRIDLFYSVGKGILLLQSGEGTFSPSDQNIYFNFKGGPDQESGLTGAGTFAPIWRDETLDLIVPEDSRVTLATSSPKGPVSVTGYGNEIALAASSQAATLAHDLDMDGYVDLFSISRDPAGQNSYHTNRGYGSFMKSELYQPDFFPRKSYKTGAGGVSVGDLNGDGADDLLIGGLDGRLVIVLNDALSIRQEAEHPIYHLAQLMKTGIVSVQVARARGSYGARCTVRNAAGELVAHRFSNHPVLTGCGGPATLNIAVRDPGPYELEVNFTDGKAMTFPFEIKAGERTMLRVDEE